ncbi:MAG: T9SS type A sorting domain-containing protein [Flavobacteriales bacterium]
MKSYFTSAVLMCLAAMAYAVPVTFRVDLSQQTVSPNGVHIAGAFQGWNPGATPMTAEGNGIYAVTLEIADGQYQYKFVNGNAWGSDEGVPQACGVDNGFGGFNRSLTVAGQALELDVVCYGQCAACVQQQFSAVTFRVNMNEQTVSPNGVHVAGNFQGWNPGGTALSDADMDGVYEVTVNVTEGTAIFYKFINGNDWPQAELVPGECGVDDGFGGFNRSADVGQNDLTLPVTCFGGCEDCEQIEPTPVSVTFQVDMSNQTVSPQGVYLTGNFVMWMPAAVALENAGNGIYSATIELLPGDYDFRFANGDQAADQESVPVFCGAENEEEGLVRYIEVTAGEPLIIPAVCFSECAECNSTEPTNLITFRVNMSELTVSPNGVHIAGNFQGWDPAATPLADEGNGIWAVTVEVDEWANLNFKFINGNAWGSDESVPGSCAVNGNRTFTVGADDIVLDVVCFGSCLDCGVEPEMVMVLFQVDMSNTTVSPNGVHVAGNFQGWNPNGTVMTELGGGIYEISYPVEANSTIQFRFINGSDWPDSETVPSACGVDDGFGGFNRTIEVGSGNTVYGPVCFSSCEACVPQVPVLVTFRVNMNNENVSPDGVFVVGDFNDWDPEATMMSEFEPGVYQAVGVVNSGTTIQYKFLNGPDFAGEETVPGDCGVDNGFGGFNRSFTAGSDNEIIPVVCFSGCADCTGSGNVSVTFVVDMSQQTVSPEGVHIAGSFNGFSATASEMTQVSPGVYHFTTGIAPNTPVTYKFINGNDFAFVESVPFECGVDDGFGGFNRTFTTPANSVQLNEVCFGSCVDCTVNVEEGSLTNPEVYPNPANNIIRIRGNAAGTSTAIVTDCTGREVMRVAGVNADERVADVSALSAGLYVIRFEGTSYRVSLIIK